LLEIPPWVVIAPTLVKPCAAFLLAITESITGKTGVVVFEFCMFKHAARDERNLFD
jgi:hypothetical protein